MAYALLSTVVFSLVLGALLYIFRARWVPVAQDLLSQIRIPGRDYLYSRLPTTFAGDIEAGLSSDTFDLSGNVGEGDSRAGLDDASKREILKLMKKRRIKFDEARRMYMENRFKANGIGADGRPKDPKFVSFS
jgi:hypothetical protein